MAGNLALYGMMTKFSWSAFLLLLLGIILVSGGLSSPGQTTISLLLFAWMTAAALPASVLLFGRTRESLFFLIPVGLVIHSVVLSVAGLLFGINQTVFLVYLILLAPFAWREWKKRMDRQDQPSDETALWVWLLLTFVAIAIPLMRVGADTDGGMAFRAYFNYDFLKHLSIAGSLSGSGIPPSNPYVSGHTLHYYWFFYVMPAFWMRMFSDLPPHSIMIMFTMLGALALVVSLYGALRLMVTSKLALWLSFLLLVTGGSYEGIYGIYRLQERGLGWTAFTTLNLDGLTRWYWKTPQIDALYRSLLYAPQHLTVLCVFLIWLCLRKRKIPLSGKVLLYLLVFSTLGFGAILGAFLIGAVALFLLFDVIRNLEGKKGESLAFVGLGALFLTSYFPVFRMFLLEGGSLEFGIVAPIRDRLPLYLLLNLGALLPFGLAGFVWRHKKVPATVLMFLSATSLFCMHFVKDHVGGSEVTLKLGYLVDLCLLISAAGFFQRFAESTGRRLRWLVPVFAVILAPAILTWAMDVYNTQDVYNRRFTTYVPQDEKESFDWMRENLPVDAVVQTDTLDAGQPNVSTLPPLAQRNMYLGDQFHARAFQVPGVEVDHRRQVVLALSRQKGSAGLSAVAQQAGIDYLMVGHRSGEMRNFLADPFFTTVFENGEAKVVKVNNLTVVDGVSEDDADLLWKDDAGNFLRMEYQGFYDPEAGPDFLPRRWMENEGRIILHSSLDLDGTLRLNISSLGRRRSVHILFDGRLIHQQEVQTGGTEVLFPLSLGSGENTLTLHCPEGAEVADLYAQNGDQRLLSLQVRKLQFER